ncbi:MAG: hypothetical protein MZV64_28635 [Ignavibacteriales bacterium]|nr:hypothetical protein [Ignavibacteriales bacterium]
MEKDNHQSAGEIDELGGPLGHPEPTGAQDPHPDDSPDRRSAVVLGDSGRSAA